MKRQLIYHTHVTTNQSKNIAVKVKTGTENTICFLNRISRDGITLSCNTEALHKLMPNKTSIDPKDPISFSICFTLDQNIQANCRVIFARRLSKDQFIMELKFIDIDEQAMQNLDAYIDRTLKSGLKPAEEHKIQPEPKVKTREIYKINEDLRITYSKVA
tara:strand:- start:13 stop:492 length:480 start_codon:yes stop_codon:yes gene_type:complete